MTIAAQARTAMQPTNRIDAPPRPAPKPKPASTRDLHGASAIAYDNAPDRPAYKTEPLAISRTYYVEEKAGERRYFDDYQRTALAMRATPTSISTKREDLKTIRAMLDIAQARGWDNLQVRGKTSFKREAWIEATARGLEVRGYTATGPDQQEADRRRAEHAATRRLDEARPRPNPGPAAPASRKETESAPSKSAAKQRSPTAGAAIAHQKLERDRAKELSPDGRLMLAVLSEKIDRQMRHHYADVRAELKAFAATALAKKERAEGPIVLSAEQKQKTTAPAPPKASPAATRTPTTPSAPSRTEPAAPRQTISR